MDNNDIETAIREEMRLSAAECHDEAWAASVLAGVETDIIAETAIATALGEIQRSGGESAAIALLERMREKVIAGELDPSPVRH